MAHGPFPTSTAPATLDPAKAVLKAPKEYRVHFQTTAGLFDLTCFRDWAPKSADRFYNLVTIGYYDDAAFFRVVPSFVVQFGISANPAVSTAWKHQTVDGDVVKGENRRGTVAMAMGGKPAQFSTQVFINLKDNLNLGALGYTPVCQVDGTGMSVVDKLFSGYQGKPLQPRIESEGNSYLRKEFTSLDYVITASIVPGP